MRIKVIKNKPKDGQIPIIGLIGKTFDAEVDDDGAQIFDEKHGYMLINPGEYKTV